LDALESQPQVAAESVAARIQRLARSKIIPYPVAACMHTIRAIRNDKEYMATPVTKAETQIVTGALSLIKQWAQETGLALPIELSNFDVSN